MKKFWEISARKVAPGLICWLVASDALVAIVQHTTWWIAKPVLFLCLVFLPGVAVLRTLRIIPRSFSSGVLYSFGLSILVLMLSGLIANELLPLLGVARPLETWWALGIWNGVTLLIIALGYVTNTNMVRIKRWRIEKLSRLARLFIALSALLPIVAMAGAFRLNNGGDGLFALITLFFAAGLTCAAFLLRRRLPDGVLMWLIFSIGLSILLMTSLRGWDIVGHDIEREYSVYTLTHMHGLWNIALDRDPYNACLSITILPEMFSRLLDVSGLIVFKVLLQVIFAVCPVIVFVLLRRYVPKLAALTGSLLFLCYPTFINDSAMLTRQGVAYLFFALALLVILDNTQSKRHKFLFVLCSLGAILSHYSTAYMFVALFFGAVVCKMLIAWWHASRGQLLPDAMRKTVVSPLFALLLFAMTFIWYTQITATSGGLVVTLQKSFTSIPNLFSSDNKSADTSTALLFAGGRSQVDLYQSYLEHTPASSTTSLANAAQYAPTLRDDNLPLTPLGKQARAIGFDPAIISVLRQDFAKVLQVLALAGVLYVGYRLFSKKPQTLDPDFTCLSLAGVVVLALLVVLPVLSINYGVLRAFQQALIFLLLAIIILLVALARHLNRRVITSVTTTGILLLFLLFTGVFTQLLGGASPSLSLNNQGLYYGLYYSSRADTSSFAWLKAHVAKKQDVRAANFNRASMHDPNYPFARSDILPLQVTPSSYVYLDPAQVTTQRAYIYYDSSPLIMTFPLGYYDEAKDEIFSTTSTRIYR